MAERRYVPIDVGDIVDGRYQILRDLGRGAAGTVFEARHLFTNRFVAVKIVRSDTHARPNELRARLQREGKALAGIRHHGVVDILDGGVTVDGSAYIVMEMLEGRTLEGLLAARGRISVANTVGVALQLCDALEAVHKAGVVHRDIKPGNIIVLRDTSGHERIKLVDFGVARIPNPSEEKLTVPGAILGTPAYMSPEQLMGLEEIDHATDVYSIGVTMFECLSGSMPHPGNYAQVLLSATRDSAPKLRTVPGGESVPSDLATVVDQAILRARSARFATASDLRTAIESATPSASRDTTLLGPPPMRRGSPGTADAAQRRRNPRAPYNTPIRLLLQGGVLDGRTEDISEEGMLVISRAVCAPNQRVVVRFALPMEGKVVSLEADVRWVRLADSSSPEGLRAIGLELVDPLPAVRESVRRYVELMSEKRTGD